MGFFIPINAKDGAGGRAALDRLGAAVSDVLDRVGVTEEELVTDITESLRRSP